MEKIGQIPGIILALLMVAQSAWAISCPSVAKIKEGQLEGFQLINANNNLIAEKEDAKRKFSHHISHFYQASFFEDGIINAHCYYRGYEELYLGKMVGGISLDADGAWQNFDILWRCRSNNVNDCSFRPL